MLQWSTEAIHYPSDTATVNLHMNINDPPLFDTAMVNLHMNINDPPLFDAVVNPHMNINDPPLFDAVVNLHMNINDPPLFESVVNLHMNINDPHWSCGQPAREHNWPPVFAAAVVNLHMNITDPLCLPLQWSTCTPTAVPGCWASQRTRASCTWGCSRAPANPSRSWTWRWLPRTTRCWTPCLSTPFSSALPSRRTASTCSRSGSLTTRMRKLSLCAADCMYCYTVLLFCWVGR